MSEDEVYFEGRVSVKRTFLWVERWIVIFGDRIEYHQPDRPHLPRAVMNVENVLVSGIIRRHGSFEFTITSGKARFSQRLRLRQPHLVEAERIHSIISDLSRDLKPSNEKTCEGDRVQDLRTNRLADSLEDGVGSLQRMGNPHFSINILAAILVVFATLIAPVLNSLLLTGSAALFLGVVGAVVIRMYSLDVPTLHLILSFASPSRSAGFQSRLDDVEVSSNSGNSSINEIGYSSAAPGSPERPRIDLAQDMSVLFSESCKFLSSIASTNSNQASACYSVMLSISETVIRLVQSMPESIAPPANLRVVIPLGISVQRNVRIVPDDLEFTRSEWTVIRNKNGLRVLTSKLSSSLTRWPIISSVGTVKTCFKNVYRAVSIPDVFKKVDEFGGQFRLVQYTELLAPCNLQDDQQPIDPDSILNPEKAPVLVKYQEMKSVWPVAPRDYLAIQTGFSLESGDSRKGQLLIAKSADPLPEDPFPDGQEGFVRGSLTASAFILLENQTDPAFTDVWTFLHCDMRGNISGNGKLAEFITQSQMPKFFAKLEAVASSLD